MTLRIAVVGNCHGGVIAQAIRQALHLVPDLDCRHIVSYSDNDQQAQAFMGEADRVVMQVTDFRSGKATLPEVLQRSDRVVLFPSIACNFLYPFAGKAHPLTAATRSTACPGGFHEGQLSDSVLLGLMESMSGAPDAAIVERYLAQDYAQLTDLDRLYEINRMKMQRIGAAAGLDLWPKIDRMFRDAPLFWTYLHPAGVLLRALCRHVLDGLRLGITDHDIRAVLATMQEPLGFAHTPIHPSVVRHFGIDWAGPAYKYRMTPEGDFTAEESAYRFVRFEHDVPLVTAVYNLHSSIDIPAAIVALEAARARSPENCNVMMHLAFGYWREGRLQQAMEAAVSAVERTPDNREWASMLCIIARQMGLSMPCAHADA